MGSLENKDAPKNYKCQFWAPSFQILAKTLTTIIILSTARSAPVQDLARTRPACLLDRQLPENLLFGTGENFYEEFPISTFLGL